VPTSYQEKLDNQNFRLFDITEEEEEVKQNSQRTLKSLEKTKLKSFLPFFHHFTITRHNNKFKSVCVVSCNTVTRDVLSIGV
jgi:hypothetical protein